MLWSDFWTTSSRYTPVAIEVPSVSFARPDDDTVTSRTKTGKMEQDYVYLVTGYLLSPARCESFRIQPTIAIPSNRSRAGWKDICTQLLLMCHIACAQRPTPAKFQKGRSDTKKDTISPHHASPSFWFPQVRPLQISKSIWLTSAEFGICCLAGQISSPAAFSLLKCS